MTVKRNRVAWVIGATGLIGQSLIRQLCEHPAYQSVISFQRKDELPVHENHQIYCTDLMNQAIDVNALPAPDDLFCAIGSTMKKARTKTQFTIVDHDIPLHWAEMVKPFQPTFIIISSIGADADSRVFYTRTKGQTELDLMELHLPRLAILRPSVLTGPRSEFRFRESVGKGMMGLMAPFLRGRANRYRPISGRDVATAMIAIAKRQSEKIRVYESDEIQRIANGVKITGVH